MAARRAHTLHDAWAAVRAQPNVQEAIRAHQERADQERLARSLATTPAPPATVVPAGPAMNKTETRYAQRLEAARRAGDIIDFRFEAITLCITSKLRQRRRYTPDFFVFHLDGTIELVEVKGAFVYEDARLKFEFAVEQWCDVFAFTWAQWARGQWSIQTHPRRPTTSAAG